MAIYDNKGRIIDAMRFIYDVYGEDAKPVDFDEKTGIANVKMTNGKIWPFDIPKYALGKYKIKIGKMTGLNLQEDATEDSPANFLDRIKMSFSVNQDAPDGIKNIRKDFQDAQMTEDGTLVVKEKGIWKRVDPSGLDPGDIADMVGYLLPLGLGGATAGATLPIAELATITSGPFSPAVGPVANLAAGGLTLAAGTGGEIMRQKIGGALGVKKPGLHRPSVALEAASWLTAPIINKILAKTWAGPLIKKGFGVGKFKTPVDVPGAKEGLKYLTAATFELTANIPRDVTMYVFEHPEVLKASVPAITEQLSRMKGKSKMKIKINMPDGEVYVLSADARDKLISALDETGREIQKTITESPTIREMKIDKNEFLSKLLMTPERVVNEVWGGVDRFTPKQRAFIAELAKDFETKAGSQNMAYMQKGVQKSREYLSPDKIHNIKQKIYDSIDFNDSFNEGDIFLLQFADDIGETLGTKIPAYKVANEKYGAYKEVSKKFWRRIPKKEDQVAMAQASEKISRIMKKSAMGKAQESEKLALKGLEEKTGVQVATGAEEIGKRMEADRLAPWMAAASWPQMIKKGIGLATGPVGKGAKAAASQVIGPPGRSTMLSKTLMNLLGRNLNGNP